MKVLDSKEKIVEHLKSLDFIVDYRFSIVVGMSYPGLIPLLKEEGFHIKNDGAFFTVTKSL